METIYKLLQTVSSTFWVVVIYGIKEKWEVVHIPSWLFGIVLMFLPIILSGISILLTLLRSKDSFGNCNDIEDVDNSFLPTYLGYFFVGLGIEQLQVLILVYIIITLFVYVSLKQYYNPIFLLFGYRFYNAETNSRTKIFLITKNDYRNPNEVYLNNLRRINDTTFFAWRNR